MEEKNISKGSSDELAGQLHKCEQSGVAERFLDQFVALLTENCDIADLVNKKKEDYIDQNHLRYHFNVITAAARGKLKETAHSIILAYMMRHPKIQKSFIYHFLGISFSDFMEVDTEFGNASSHIDIILHDKSHCIIIENKANGAVEQPHQVYRYVRDIAEQQLKIDRENIYVLYLNPWNHSLPSIQSVTDENGKDNLMESLGGRFVVKSFALDITEWLKTIDMPEEPIIESGINQYIDYLEHFFHTSNIYKPMKKEIKNYLLKEYAINESDSLDEQIEILVNKKENVDYLAEQLGSLILDKKADRAALKLVSMYNQMLVDFKDVEGVDFYNKTEDRPYINVGLGLIIKGIKINFHIEYHQMNSTIYYGIICPKSEYPESYKFIYETFTPYMDSLPSDKQKADSMWPVWRITSFENAYSRLKALVEYALSL